MNALRTGAATASIRADSAHKRERVLTIARSLIERGQDFSWEQLGRASGFKDGGFIHRAPGLKDEIRAIREAGTTELATGLARGTAITTASMRAENVSLRRQLATSQAEVKTLRMRLGEALGTQSVREGPTVQELEERAKRLEQDLFEAREATRDYEEQLEAARTVNKDLFRRQNTSTR